MSDKTATSTTTPIPQPDEPGMAVDQDTGTVTATPSEMPGVVEAEKAQEKARERDAKSADSRR